MLFSFYRNSGNFVPALLGRKRSYESKDITAIVSIRAHEGNSWALERLSRIRGYYQSPPLFLIVDFGSEDKFSAQISKICSENRFSYLRVEDSGIFSLSAARNAGFNKVKTDLVYFTDIDFFSTPDHFSKLAEYATRHNFGVIRDIVLNIPAYHLNEEHSREVFELSGDQRSNYLSELSVTCAENAVGHSCEFVAPYSNNFLCTRTFFDLSGGYDTGFRGHGSEDFELMVRFGLHKDAVQFPKRVKKDMYSPSRKTFFGPRSYAGFRRLAEVDSFRAESSGFKTFHLWHPTNGDCSWRRNNDWRRARLNQSLSKVIGNPLGLLKTDYLERRKVALCVCRNPQHVGYFLPLRALGYRIEVLDGSGPDEVAEAKIRMEKGEFDAFFVFSPYASSQRDFLELFQMAKTLCEERIVIEHGALPFSVYYANDVSCDDPAYQAFTESDYQPSEETIAATEIFMNRIVEGDWVPGNSDSFEVTKKKLEPSTGRERTTVFLPLQSRGDMEANRFLSSEQSYADYEDSIASIALSNPEIDFFVKPHSPGSFQLHDCPQNLHECAVSDNIHALVEACEYVVVYNSEVGLLGLIHGKKLISVGNTFYNLPGLGTRVDRLSDAIDLIQRKQADTPDIPLLKRFLAWLISEKYSFFDSNNHIGNAHNLAPEEYVGIMITLFNWNGIHLPLGRSRGFSRVDAGSYIDGRLGLNIGRFIARGYADSIRSQSRRFFLQMRQRYRDFF